MCVCCVRVGHNGIWLGVSGTGAERARLGMGREANQQESNAGNLG